MLNGVISDGAVPESALSELSGQAQLHPLVESGCQLSPDEYPKPRSANPLVGFHVLGDKAEITGLIPGDDIFMRNGLFSIFSMDPLASIIAQACLPGGIDSQVY